MAAGVVASEKLTLAVPIASVKCYLVRTVVSVKISFEPGDTYAFFLFRIFPGLVNLPYEARVHHHPQEVYPRPDEVILGSRGAKVKTYTSGTIEIPTLDIGPGPANGLSGVRRPRHGFGSGYIVVWDKQSGTSSLGQVAWDK